MYFYRFGGVSRPRVTSKVPNNFYLIEVLLQEFYFKSQLSEIQKCLENQPLRTNFLKSECSQL